MLFHFCGPWQLSRMCCHLLNHSCCFSATNYRQFTRWQLCTCRLRTSSTRRRKQELLWSPYGIGQTIIFCRVVTSFFLLSFFSSPNLSRRRLDVCHTSTHDVALVRISDAGLKPAACGAARAFPFPTLVSGCR